MATFIPFKGVLPSIRQAKHIPSKTVARYNHSEFQDELKNNPYSFLQIIFPKQPEKIKNSNSEEYLKKIKFNYDEFVKKKLLIKDTNKSFYLYRQKKNNDIYTGFIGCCSIDDYLNGVIKVHEQTLHHRVEKLTNYLKICDINAEPVLITYPDDAKINELTKKLLLSSPTFDFVTEGDSVQHTLWQIADSTIIEQIEDCFKAIPNLYIADGHHRSASSSLFAKYQREQHPEYTGKEAFNFMLTLIVPESQLHIYDYNRVLKNLNGLSPDELIIKLSDYFIVNEVNKESYVPSSKGIIGMYIKKQWYSLKIKHELLKEGEHILDVAYLSEYVFDTILKLNKTSQIKFVEGTKGTSELKKYVDSGKYEAAFALYPLNINDIKQIADAGQTMPPKTTWIEPKLRSGMVIYEL